MKELQENLFNQALSRLSAGESIEAICQEFVDYPELREQLQLAQLLREIPVAKPPAPSMRYRYSQKVGFMSQLVSLFGSYRLAAVPLAIMLMLASGFGIISAADNSLPGDKLYGMKLAAEQAQLKLTFDEEKQAQFHLLLSKKRLEEARQVIALQNPEREALALNALAKQTELTLSRTPTNGSRPAAAR